MKPLFCRCLRLSSVSSLGLESRRCLSPFDPPPGLETLQACLRPSLDFGLVHSCRLRLGLCPGSCQGLMPRGPQGGLGLVKPLSCSRLRRSLDSQLGLETRSSALCSS